MENTTNTRGRKFLRTGVFGVVSLAVLFAAFFLLQHQLSASQKPEKAAKPPAMPPVTVEVKTVEVAPSVREISTVGTLHANESVIIRSEVGGRIVGLEFAEGEAVEADTILFRLDQSVLQAQLAKAEAELNLHRSDYKRAESLLKNQAISERERDQAYSQLKTDEANIRLIRAQSDKTVIRAPFSGTLGLRRVSIGDVINAGQDLVNLEDVSMLKAEFKIPEIHSDLIAKGQKVELRTDAFPDEMFEAEIYAINPRIDQQGRSLVVRAVLGNPEQRLRPGQFVQAGVEVSREENALFIPEQAVIPQPNRQFVWKVQNEQAVMSEIKTGMRKKGMVEVKFGLQAGDRVITGGIQKIAEGMPVKAVEADPNMFGKG
ncbi:MAG: hypothetical protein BWK80_61645 [Desulfobacteraceae bacterium IS3]|nr:MAG: hypothetical protein BWK80_61645 [Desulfobacteraceae bacterium IS3]